MTSPFQPAWIEPPDVAKALPEPEHPSWWRCNDARGLDLDLAAEYFYQPDPPPGHVVLQDVRHYLRVGDEWHPLRENAAGAGCLTFNTEGSLTVCCDEPPTAGEWHAWQWNG